MLVRVKRTIAVLTATGAVAGAAAVPAADAQQQGLVNVNIQNVANNNNVAITVPINAAANICGVAVNVLAQNLQNGPVNCNARANQVVTVRQIPAV